MNRIIVLVGIPGCGKSTWAANYLKDNPSAVVINQDTLGSKDACVNAILKVVATTDTLPDIIIDRTNIDKHQRSHWVKLAKYFKIRQIECVEFQIDPNLAINRISKRLNHPTINNKTLVQIRQIVLKFIKSYQEVEVHNESFNKHTIINVDSSTVLVQTNYSLYNRFWSFVKSSVHSFSCRLQKL